MKIKTAMILAAGYGKRLKLITKKIPKPLVKVYDKPLLSYAIDSLYALGIEKIIINTHYKAGLIKDYIISNYKSSKIVLTYEPRLLNTGGGVKNVLKYIKENMILVINCDTFWNKKTRSDLKNLLLTHNNSLYKCSLLLSDLNKSFGIENNKGDFLFKNKHVLRNYLYNKGFIYSGAQIIDKSILNLLSKNVFSFNEIWDSLIKEKKITAVLMKSDLLHLGTTKSFNFLNKFRP